MVEPGSRAIQAALESAGTAALASSKAISIGEFIRNFGIKRHTDLVLAFGYYLEKHSGVSSFTAADIGRCYYDAKMDTSNVSQSIIQNIKRGFIMHAKSALEVLEHGLFHYFRSDTPRDMKFALLHIDQRIELLLKERVRVGGKSIYKNPKETIGVYRAYEIIIDELKCAIPEKPDLELLHEERNNIQHKYSNPSPEDAAFHVEKAMTFIRRFVKDELGLNIQDHLPSVYLTLEEFP
jgi:hypothetical protein